MEWWREGAFGEGGWGRGEGGVRGDAGRVLRAGVEGADVEGCTAAALEGRVVGEGVVVIAVGKAAERMVAGASGVLGDVLEGGVVVGQADAGVVGRGAIPRVRRVRGGHPLPDHGSVAAAEAVLAAAGGAGASDTVLCLLSGGASAMICRPAGRLTLEDVRETTRLLLLADATIEATNAVRKHLDAVKGGGLARVIAPARTIGLVVSDVPGDRLDVIASGPLSADPTTYGDAVRVLRDLRLWDRVPRRVREHLEAGMEGVWPETVKAGDAVLERVSVSIVLSARHALNAAALEAERLGYAVELGSAEVTGLAQDVGRALAARIASGADGRRRAILQAGETTVDVAGPGRGGRNQEVALGALPVIPAGAAILVAALGTDGVDGPTDAAGALVTGSSAARATAAGLDPVQALARNDAYPFFDQLGDLIRTGPTGTNVMDLHIALSRPEVDGSADDQSTGPKL
jgi:glycerate 2-kinase